MTTAATPQSGYTATISTRAGNEEPYDPSSSVLLSFRQLSTDDSRLPGHDQLYSPAILVNSRVGQASRLPFSPKKRSQRLCLLSQYDAYGACRVLNDNYTADADGKPDFGNPFLFTGREVDFLDGGSLPLQYNRHRYYSQTLGRWTSEDPLGIDPTGYLHQNYLSAMGQYKDGLSLYLYARLRPLQRQDPLGLLCKDKCKPGEIRFNEATLTASWPGQDERHRAPWGLGEIASVSLNLQNGRIEWDVADARTFYELLVQALCEGANPVAGMTGVTMANATAGMGLVFDIEVKFDCCSRKQTCVFSTIINFLAGAHEVCWRWNWENDLEEQQTVRSLSGGMGNMLDDHYGPSPASAPINELFQDVLSASRNVIATARQTCWNLTRQPR